MNGNTALEADEERNFIPAIPFTFPAANEYEELNISEARRWVLNPQVFRRIDPFDEAFVRELHKRMFGKTWTWAGVYRTTNKNLGLPFHQILERLGQLLANGRYWVDKTVYPADEIAIRFHHEMVVIHPFSNGNGRHARLYADIIVRRLGRDEFSWGSGNDLRSKSSRARDEYIAALKEADESGGFDKLMTFARS
jgi:Fic-DOC domain mobile mystery protein B